MSSRPKIAAVISTFYRASHADVILTKLVRGIPTDEGLLSPRVEIASIYMDQISERDVGLRLAREHGIPVFQSIPQALCLGGKDLAVDGVISIGEHGFRPDYGSGPYMLLMTAAVSLARRDLSDPLYSADAAAFLRGDLVAIFADCLGFEGSFL